MPESNSFIQIRKLHLRELCENAILKVKECRKRKESEYILKQIEERDWWLRRLLGKKRMTFDEMKAQIEYEISSHDSDFYLPHFGGYPSTSGWRTLDFAEKLLKACNCDKSEDIMLVSVEELNHLSS